MEAAREVLLSQLPEDRSTWNDFMKGQFSFEDRAIRGVLTPEELATVEAEVEAGGTEVYMVWHYLLAGDLDRVFKEALSIPEFEDLFFRIAYSPGGKSIVEHPRFIEIGEQNGLMPIWLVKGYPMGCSRVQDEIGDHLLCPSWPE
jgi:hypothetical protein